MIETLSTSKLSLKFYRASIVVEHSISIGHNIKWDPFEILASSQCDLQCKIKETLLIQDLKPALNENVGSENSPSLLITPNVVSFFPLLSS